MNCAHKHALHAHPPGGWRRCGAAGAAAAVLSAQSFPPGAVCFFRFVALHSINSRTAFGGIQASTCGPPPGALAAKKPSCWGSGSPAHLPQK